MNKPAYAIRQGIYHSLHSIPCQDYVGWDGNGNVTAIALCDGAGSCKDSEKAAKYFAEKVPKLLCAGFDDLYSQTEQGDNALLKQTFLNMLRSDEEAQIFWNNDALTTLLFVAVRNDGCWIAGHIGDGVILFQNEINTQTLSKPENGLTPSETFFINEEPTYAAEHLRFYHNCSQGRIAFLLSSDGCENALRRESGAPSDKALQLFEDLYRYPATMSKELQKYLDEYFAELSEDDLSIGMLHCLCGDE